MTDKTTTDATDTETTAAPAVASSLTDARARGHRADAV